MPDDIPCGALNKITDVAGLKVGHHTIIQDEPVLLRTGTSVLEIADVNEQPVAAACHVFNGYGKTLGLMQVEELGSMESHVYLTNTLSTGAIHQGAIKAVLSRNPEVKTFNPVVAECNDGMMSNIAALAITPEMVPLAHRNATRDFELGSVGAGTGMICFGFKGGFGSSSRMIEIDGQSFVLGVLVLSNFGRREDLRIPGMHHRFAGGPGTGQGSLIMIAATDLPLLPHQLERVARHMTMAIGFLGAPGHHGSGDIALAFSTSQRIEKSPAITSKPILSENGELMNRIFRAAVWSTAEAILDSLFTSPTMKGINGEVLSIRDVIE